MYNAPNTLDCWVFRQPTEKFRRDLVNAQHHVKPKISHLLWAGVAKGEKAALVAMTRNDNSPQNGYTRWSYIKALEEGLVPFLHQFQHFQQDNAPIHKAIESIDWLNRHGIRSIDWPAHSPDLNPIEHIWKALKAKLRRMHPHLRDLRNNEEDRAILLSWIQAAWAALPESLVRRLTSSVGSRLRAVIQAQGWYTKY